MFTWLFCPYNVQTGANGMLDDWEENLAVITANRTKGDELVIIHLGDCLWKDRSEVRHYCFHNLFELYFFFSLQSIFLNKNCEFYFR